METVPPRNLSSPINSQYYKIILPISYWCFIGYGLDSEKFDDFKYDINRFTLVALLGLELLMSPRWSLLLQTHLCVFLPKLKTKT